MTDPHAAPPTADAHDHGHGNQPPRRSSLSDVATMLGFGSTIALIIAEVFVFTAFAVGWMPLRVAQALVPIWLVGCAVYGLLQIGWVWARNQNKESLLLLDKISTWLALMPTPVIAFCWVFGLVRLGEEGAWMFAGVLLANAFDGLASALAWSLKATARDENAAPS